VGTYFLSVSYFFSLLHTTHPRNGAWSSLYNGGTRGGIEKRKKKGELGRCETNQSPTETPHIHQSPILTSLHPPFTSSPVEYIDKTTYTTSWNPHHPRSCPTLHLCNEGTQTRCSPWFQVVVSFNPWRNRSSMDKAITSSHLFKTTK
jgi:hypothetical protein